MSVDERDIIPSPVDPDYECVPIGDATSGRQPTPPDQSGTPVDEPKAQRLCPDGYVPRRKRRPYHLEGKEGRTGEPTERNPGSTAP